MSIDQTGREWALRWYSLL